MALLVLLAAGFVGFLAREKPYLTQYVLGIYLLLAACVGIILVFYDRMLLETVKKRRSHRIVKEIYVLSNHLLYYSGSALNLHGKLLRCMPYAKVLRHHLQLLLNDWYRDPGQALRTFKARLGTDEGASFAETLNSLRLYEHGAYYGLLKQRILDYKDKIALVKESRKETVSYLLFVLAGIPILNTFRIFLYPWVQEGQKLFGSLN